MQKAIHENSFLLRRTGYLLRKLEADTQPEWGGMTAQHMVEHLSVLVHISTGRIKVPPFFDTKQTADMRHAFLDHHHKLPQDLPVPPTGLIPLRFQNLEEAKEKLLENIGRFFSYYTENPDAVHVHPAFGPLNFQEWLHFHKKHFSYHFEQFGLGKHIYSPFLLRETTGKWLAGLSEESERGWGYMTPQHMVEHVSGLIRLSRIDNGLECVTPEEQIPSYKRFLWSNRPFQKNVPIAGLRHGQLRPLRFENLEIAKGKLKTEIDRFYQFFGEHPEATTMHPVFGPLNKDEWEQFHNKHIQHHLGAQYGLAK